VLSFTFTAEGFLTGLADGLKLVEKRPFLGFTQLETAAAMLIRRMERRIFFIATRRYWLTIKVQGSIRQEIWQTNRTSKIVACTYCV
jgi:hypothetical protein